MKFKGLVNTVKRCFINFEEFFNKFIGVTGQYSDLFEEAF